MLELGKQDDINSTILQPPAASSMYSTNNVASSKDKLFGTYTQMSKCFDIYYIILAIKESYNERPLLKTPEFHLYACNKTFRCRTVYVK
jgi:hypothetical protein